MNWQLDKLRQRQQDLFRICDRRDSTQDRRLKSLEYENACLTVRMAGLMQLLLDRKLIAPEDIKVIDALAAEVPMEPSDWPVVEDDSAEEPEDESAT